MATKMALVTGGTGMIGRHLVNRLVALGRAVAVTGRETPPAGVDYIGMDFQNLNPSDIKGCDTVFHLAAETDTRAKDDLQWQVNYDDAAEFLRMCKNHVKRIVYTSSCAVYGRGPVPFGEARDCQPLNAYGAAKLALDKLVSGWAVGLRPTNVYGPGEEHKTGRGASFVSDIVRAVKAGKPVSLYTTCSRDLIAVDDVADAFLYAEHFSPGVYNVGCGSPTEYASVALEAAKLLGKLVKIERRECPFPAEFQEYTAALTGRLAAAVGTLGLEWRPRPWRTALASYIKSGWPGKI